MKAATFYVPPYILLIASSRLQEARGASLPILSLHHSLTRKLAGSTKARQPSLEPHCASVPHPRVTVYAVAQAYCPSPGVEGTEPSTPRGLPHPHPGLYAPPASLISPSNSFLLSTLKTGISASKCQLQLGEAGTHQGLPPRQIYRAIKLSLGESGRGSS